ncbi:hypothetical protein [Tenacibaculum agarivorans]|uniref:hypothetical protein n=1 Tax=Tenacibaculum agarivorans TaxID=1908389 RepID=UPI000B2982B0|nr:hypothetical protein [Tenacibaculum agarivorans]
MKNLLTLGRSLTKTEQQKVSGGGRPGAIECEFSADTSTDWCCHFPQGCPSYA